jgi:hypothetical protein
MSAAATDVASPLQYAQEFVGRGWRPFPVERFGKRPAVGIKWGVATSTAPPEKMLAHWFGREPMNIGLAAKGSGLIFLDDDSGTGDGMEKLCEAYGQELPVTYRVRTLQGWHWYFEAPEHIEIHNAGQGSYLKDEFSFDVRGNAGGQQKAGGYVVAAGSVHESGHVYEAEDSDADVAQLPAWLLELLVIQQEHAPPSDPAQPNAEDNGKREPRYFTEKDASAWIQALAVKRLKDATEGGRNNALNTAACVVGHFVGEFFTREQATARLRQLALEIGLDEREIGPTIRSGLGAGMAEPYIKIQGNALDPPAADPDAEFKKELERERIRRRVREELDAENREPLRVLSFMEFLNAPPPRYLVPKMFYRDGLSVVFGAPGAAKSFLVFDIALCLASGKPWRGIPLGRGKVHYIMAEGQATNTLRAQGWVRYYEIAPETVDENFVVVPVPVLLTEAGVRDYLPLVERDRPDMIILDTKNLMFAGKESQGDDYGAMLRVLHQMRELAGGAAVILIDHSGLGDDSRVRGSNAQKGGVETEIRVTNDNGTRRAEVTRDKSGVEGAQWLFRLVKVDGPWGVDAEPPAVCVPVNKDEIWTGSGEPLRSSWWEAMPRNELPERVGSMSDKMGEAAGDIFRLMVYINASGTLAELPFGALFTQVNEGPRDHKRSTLYAALGALEAAGIASKGSTDSKYRLTDVYLKWGAGV